MSADKYATKNLTSGLILGVPWGALGLGGTGGASGAFPATTAASHSSIVRDEGFLVTGSAIARTIPLLCTPAWFEIFGAAKSGDERCSPRCVEVENARAGPVVVNAMTAAASITAMLEHTHTGKHTEKEQL